WVQRFNARVGCGRSAAAAVPLATDVPLLLSREHRRCTGQPPSAKAWRTLMPNPSVTGAASSGDATSADAYRAALVDQLRELGAIRTERVAGAFRAVPRHLFLPQVPLEEAYANEAVVTKRDEQGVALSSVSAPRLVAMMLEQLRMEPGQRVLEIGSGGFNAALLAELVGPQGSVTTMDIDPEVVDRARTTLDAAGYRQVRTLCADGEFGAAEYAPFDRIIVTVGAYDLPPAWVEQLAEGG